MDCKTFEIRDSATFIPMLAVKLEPACEADRYLLSRAGCGRELTTQSGYIQLCRIDGGEGTSQCDPHHWGSRTIQTAHEYIVTHWGSLSSGTVIDVEYILGETDTKKVSEAFEEI